MKFKHNNRCFYYLFYSELRHNQYQCVDNKHLIYQHTFTFVSRAKLKGKFFIKYMYAAWTCFYIRNG